MLEQIRPQIVNNPLPHQVGVLDPEYAGNPLDEKQKNDTRRNSVQHGKARAARLGRDCLIDRKAGQERNRQLRYGSQHHHQQNDRHNLSHIRSHVAEQPAELLPVERLVDDIVIFIDKSFAQFRIFGFRAFIILALYH
ncbi:hypothetical protein D3C71_1301330 [compost metagenome]